MAQRSCLHAPHPAEEVNIDFTCLENLNSSTVLEHQLQGPKIFTDGSRIKVRVWAALSHWKNGKETEGHKYKLERFCIVFQAEMYALYQATETILKQNETCTNEVNDSRSALELLRSERSFHPLVFKIKSNISKPSKTFLDMSTRRCNRERKGR